MTTTRPSGRTAAAALGAGALCWALIGIVHPRVRHGGDVTGQIARLSSHLAMVHAMALAAAVALLFGLAAFSLRRGIGRSPVLAALVVYAVATVAVVAAGTIDGFIVAGIATSSELLLACSVAIQAFTKVGFVGYAVAIVLWSADLARERGALRAVGIFGCAVAVGTAAVMIGTPHIGSHELVIIGLLQGIWYAALAGLLAGDRV